jgi:hypothetical protein
MIAEKETQPPAAIVAVEMDAEALRAEVGSAVLVADVERLREVSAMLMSEIARASLLGKAYVVPAEVGQGLALCALRDQPQAFEALLPLVPYISNFSSVVRLMVEEGVAWPLDRFLGECFLSLDDRKEVFVSAARAGRVDVLSFLLRMGVDVHADSDNALLQACLAEETDAVACLLDAGADAFARDGAIQFIVASASSGMESVRQVFVARKVRLSFRRRSFPSGD